MKDLEIGTAVLRYGEDGKITGASFAADMTLPLEGDIASQLTYIKCKPTMLSIQQTAESTLAAWFNRMNMVELADRSDYEVSSEVLEGTQYYENEIIKEIKIKFTFKKIKQ